MEIKIRLPRIPSGSLANLVGLLGLVAVAFAGGALLGSWWWSVLLGGVFAVTLSAIAQSYVAAEGAGQEGVRPIAEARRTG